MLHTRPTATDASPSRSTRAFTSSFSSATRRPGRGSPWAARRGRRTSCVDAALPDGQVLPLCRLRYAGYANNWGFAIWRASHDDYQESFLPNGSMGGSAEGALDTACGLCVADPTAWA